VRVAAGTKIRTVAGGGKAAGGLRNGSDISGATRVK
jgi:hypothetical protein